MSRTPLLRLQDVTCAFGGVIALNKVSLQVEAGQICGLIGPNGAGKTTLFNCLSRFYTPSSGSIYFGETEISSLPAYRMVTLGIGRTFQNLALFPTMSVSENIMIGAHHLMRSGFITDVLRLPFVRREERRSRQTIDDLIRFLDLGSVRDVRVSELPFATRKRVELGRALASKARLLLLDEPAGGLSYQEVDNLRLLILSLRDVFGITVLLVEHHMNLVMRVSDRVIALDFGRKIADGTPEEIREHPDVIRAYLGADQ